VTAWADMTECKKIIYSVTN